MDIGPYYVDECCIEAGYDEMGNLKKKPLDLQGLPPEEEIKAQAEGLKDDTSPEPAEVVEETAEQKKARKKAEKEAKAAAKAKAKAEKEAKKQA